MTALLATKLHQPAPPAHRVRRPHLVQRLNEGLASGRQVILVSAPAGFGKTTLISAWVHALDGLPVTWLSLEPADDDPARFFAYLLAALKKVDPDVGQEIEGALRAGQLPPAHVLSTTLINDMLGLESRFLLVLDDFQVIQDPFILQLVERLIASPPRPLHLVLLAREDPPLPLARLRANNRLTEIRARELRFSRADAERFLNEVMGLSLPPDDVATLELKTEGWIVGLQLAGLSVRDRADPSQFIATLSGGHRFILSYLTEQVLDRQPPEIRDFLLRTSILDKVNGDLCDAVTGRSDGRVLLERLFNANLFLIPLDDEGRWYRYHHLFADLLRGLQNALRKDEVAALHQRASRWYAQAGTGAPGAFAGEAIQHALAAEDYGLAVELLETHAMEMVMQGFAKTVHGWVQAIPAEWASSSPRTNLAFAWMHLLRGAQAKAVSYIARLEQIYSDPQVSAADRRTLKAEWLVMQSLLMNMEGRMTQSLAAAGEALEIAREEEDRVRSLAHFGQASAYQAMHDYQRAVESYQQALQHGRASGNPIAEMMSTSGLAQLALEHGQLHLAHDIAAPVSDRVEGSGSPLPISTVVFGILGDVYYQWFEIEKARRHMQRALQLSTLGGYNSGITNCCVLLSRVSQLEGDLEAASREIQKAIESMRAEPPDYVRQEAVAQQVRVYLARHRPAAAELTLQGLGFSFGHHFSFPAFAAGETVSHSPGVLYNSSLHALLYRARSGQDPAGLLPGFALADRLVAGALQNQYIIVALEALLLRAQMHALLGDHPASLADYVQALELGEPEGFIGVFVEQGPPVAAALGNLVRQGQLGPVPPAYVERVLEAFAGRQPASTTRSERRVADPAEALIEPLTDRELDVLHLMSEGLKYKEIAARLFISLNTVRFHVKAIYGKLDVNNRTQAIEAARRLNLL